MDLGRTALRLIIGPLFVGHGTQKLFGWSGPRPRRHRRVLREARPQAGQAPGGGGRRGRGGRRCAAHARRADPRGGGAGDRHDDHRHPQGPPPEGPVGPGRRLRVQPDAHRRDARRWPRPAPAARRSTRRCSRGSRARAWRSPSSPPPPPAPAAVGRARDRRRARAGRRRGDRAERQDRFAREPAEVPARLVRSAAPQPGGTPVGRAELRTILVPSCAIDRPRPPTSRPSHVPRLEPRPCPACATDFVNPVDWAAIEDHSWTMLLRCPQCDARPARSPSATPRPRASTKRWTARRPDRPHPPQARPRAHARHGRDADRRVAARPDRPPQTSRAALGSPACGLPACRLCPSPSWRLPRRPPSAQVQLPAKPQTTSLDSEAPPGAPPHWLPNEPWVMQHWLPYDEQRLYSLLGVDRGVIWR